MAIKNVLLKKKIEGVVYDIYAKSSANLITYGEASNVATELSNLATALNDITKEQGTIDTKVKAESKALYNKIMGFTDDDTSINEAYDTLKEVAAYLNEHGAVVQGFTNNISQLQSDLTALTSRVSANESSISALQTTVGNASSGLVKSVADNKSAIAGNKSSISALTSRVSINENNITTAQDDISTLKTTVGNASSGLVKDVAANTAAINTLKSSSTNVTASETNGNIVVDGDEVTVYDDSKIAASKIVQDATHRFVSDTEKSTWNADAKIIVSSTIPSNLAEKDLLLLTIS